MISVEETVKCPGDSSKKHQGSFTGVGTTKLLINRKFHHCLNWLGAQKEGDRTFLFFFFKRENRAVTKIKHRWLRRKIYYYRSLTPIPVPMPK